EGMKYEDFIVGNDYTCDSHVWQCLYADHTVALMEMNGIHRIVHQPFLWREVPPPKKSGTFWLNIFDDGTVGAGHKTREKADSVNQHTAFGSIRIACVEVNWTEGDGLA